MQVISNPSTGIKGRAYIKERPFYVGDKPVIANAPSRLPEQ